MRIIEPKAATRWKSQGSGKNVPATDSKRAILKASQNAPKTSYTELYNREQNILDYILPSENWAISLEHSRYIVWSWNQTELAEYLHKPLIYCSVRDHLQ